MNIGIATVFRQDLDGLGTSGIEYLVSPSGGPQTQYGAAFSAVVREVGRSSGFRFLAGAEDSEMNMLGDLGKGDELLGLVSSNRICNVCYGRLGAAVRSGMINLVFHDVIGIGTKPSSMSSVYRAAYTPDYYNG